MVCLLKGLLMARKKWDAIVIGAGPAGASAARTLVAGGLDCLLIEKKKLPRHKMCSGMLSPWAVDFVHRKFGAIPLDVYCQPNFLSGFALHFPSLRYPLVANSREAIPNVWRSSFDHFLAKASEARIRDGLALQHIENHMEGFTVTCNTSSRTGRSTSVSFTSKYVVAADGGNSRSIRRMMPKAYRGLPYGTGMQLHYRGVIDVDPRYFNVFFHRGMGFYIWANIKDDDIHVGVGGIGKHNLPAYHAEFVSLLEKNYGLEIRETLMREGMVAVVQAPLNHFTLGTGNFLAAGDAAGFMHNSGEGISCALTTGNLAAEAILSAEKTGLEALDVYRTAVRDEAELCLDQFNPLRTMKTFPFRMDMKGLWKEYSLKEMSIMWQDMKAFFAQGTSLADTGIGKILKQNMLHRLRHGRYRIDL
jgi:flavin-dependent dehydrogenase